MYSIKHSNVCCVRLNIIYIYIYIYIYILLLYFSYCNHLTYYLHLFMTVDNEH